MSDLYRGGVYLTENLTRRNRTPTFYLILPPSRSSRWHGFTTNLNPGDIISSRRRDLEIRRAGAESQAFSCSLFFYQLGIRTDIGLYKQLQQRRVKEMYRQKDFAVGSAAHLEFALIWLDGLFDWTLTWRNWTAKLFYFIDSILKPKLALTLALRLWSISVEKMFTWLETWRKETELDSVMTWKFALTLASWTIST